ncbi:GFA family protein [Caulobacter sp. 17J65-9]|uniref:GFA family protein n=1 Tax=Caulobacter sp. 17J65-9 TaxID=2709382 RepID=UPI0013C8CDBB|nr:GFA family protein [Caulobacter sp. 17J65-9]NEX91681.1 GFA family protein [Caulobacter sp. 17J65-9]
MVQSTTGACLCGAVRFEVLGGFEAFFLCHCARCRKGTGSAHAANLFASGAELTWLSGRGNVKSFRVPGTRHERSFCTECGAALPTVQMNGALLVVPAGSVESPVEIRPTAHVCFASRAEWDVGLEDVPKIDGLPG